jgi:hypothetical protein
VETSQRSARGATASRIPTAAVPMSSGQSTAYNTFLNVLAGSQSNDEGKDQNRLVFTLYY